MAKGEKCSFCGRGENEVRLLMPGRDGCICDECAEQAYLLSEEYLHKKKKAWEFWIVQSENREKMKLFTRALTTGLQSLLHPAVQKGKLAFGVEPVLAAFQHGQVCVVGLCKAGDRLQRGQMVMLCV